MNHIKTFEGFFSNLLGKKDDKKVDKNRKKGFLSSLFNKEDDDFAQKVLNSLRTALEPKNDENGSDEKSKDSSKVIGEIARYGDYKRSVKFQSNGNTYVVTVQKSSSKRRRTSKILLSPGEDYVLVINNRHFIDRKTGSPTVSQKITKNIWNLLDKEHDKKWFNKEDMEKDFE
jgi:D-lyxose ketol-isomerase